MFWLRSYSVLGRTLLLWTWASTALQLRQVAGTATHAMMRKIKPDVLKCWFGMTGIPFPYDMALDFLHLVGHVVRPEQLPLSPQVKASMRIGNSGLFSG